MKVATVKMTLEELDRLPDDGNRYELIAGELYVTPAPRIRHQRVSGRLFNRLYGFAEDHKLGFVFHAPTDVTLDVATHTRVEPDLLFISKNRRSIIGEKDIQGAPELVVEIISKSTEWVDLQDKRDLYRKYGVVEYWIVDPDENYILVYRFSESAEPRKLLPGDVLTTPLLPGLRIALDDLFAE